MMDLILYILAIVVIVLIFYVLYKLFKFIVSILLVVAFLFIAYVTNPSIEFHEEAVRQRADEHSIPMKDKSVKLEDFYVFSLTKVVENADEKLVGAGAFTKVVVFRNP